MTVYLLTLLFVVVMSLLAVRFAYGHNSLTNKPNPHLFFVISISIVLICVAGFRWHVGSDFWTYEALFDLNQKRPIFDILQGREAGFWGFVWLCGRFSRDIQVVFFLCSFITVVLMIRGIWKMSRNYVLSMYLFLATLIYFSSFNGVRQWIAAAIMFSAFPLVIKKKYFLYIMLMIFVSFFHQSVFIMLPILLFIKIRTGSALQWLSLVLFGFAITFLPFVTSFLSSLLEDNHYQSYMIINKFDDGVHPMRVLVAFTPVAIAFLYYKKLKKNVPYLDLLVNLSLLNLLFLIVAMKSTVVARLCFYTEVYNLLLIPEFLAIGSVKFQRLFVVTLVGAYFIYMLLLLPTDSRLLPYQMFFQRN